MAFYSPVTSWLGRVVTQPVSELSQMQRSVRYAIELSTHCTRQLSKNRAGQMAAALTYRTIFSLIPIVVVSVMVIGAFKGSEGVRQDIQEYAFDWLNLSSLSYERAVDVDAGPNEAEEKLANIEKIVNDLANNVADINFGSIGAIGLLILIWAAISLLVTIEYSFNQIFNCPIGRAWHRRIPVYWSVITLGPVLLLVSLYLAEQFTIWASGIALVGPAFGLFGRFTALLSSWMLLFVLYALMPNTKVFIRPALIGGLVAAILYEIGKWGFKLYVEVALPYAKLYGTLGLIPLFLFWLYITWYIVLFGMELTYTLQVLGDKKLNRKEEHNLPQLHGDTRWLIPMLTQIGLAFTEGKPVGRHDLAEQLRLPIRAVSDFGGKLEDAGFIHRVQAESDEEGAYALARPPGNILIADVLALGSDLAKAKELKKPHPGWDYFDKLNEAERDFAADATLATLVEDSKQS